MTKTAKKKASLIVALAVLCGAAVMAPSMISLGVSLFYAVVDLVS